MIIALEQSSISDVKPDALYQDIKAESSESEVVVEIMEVNSPTVPSGEYVDGAADGGGRIGLRWWRTLYGGHSFKEAWLWLFRRSRMDHSFLGLNLRFQDPVVGWRAVGEMSCSRRTALDQLVNDVFPIYLTRDVIFIFIVGVAARLLTVYGCGWDWLLILLACCFTYHTTSMNRFRQRNRDGIARDVSMTRLSSTTEHAEWVNHILERLWPVYEPLIAEEMVPRVDKVLNSIRPSCLDFLHLGELTFGMKSLQVLQVKTYPDTADDEVVMDWKIHFMPGSTPHRKHRDTRARRMNSRIVLAAGIAGFETPILVEDVSLIGWLRVRMKLSQESSSIKTLEMSFVEKPELKYALKPMGGDTFGFDIANLHIPGISSFLQAKVHLALSSMYLPNWLSLDVETLLPDKRTDAIFGILLSTFFPTLASRTRHRDS